MQSKCSTCQNHIHLISDLDEWDKSCKICDFKGFSSTAGVKECSAYKMDCWFMRWGGFLPLLRPSDEIMEKLVEPITCELCKKEEDTDETKEI